MHYSEYAKFPMLQKHHMLYVLILFTLNSPHSTESDKNSGGLTDQHIFAPLPTSKVTSINVVLPAPLTPIRAVSTLGLKTPLTPFKSSRRSSKTPCFFISYNQINTQIYFKYNQYHTNRKITFLKKMCIVPVACLKNIWSHQMWEIEVEKEEPYPSFHFC